MMFQNIVLVYMDIIFTSMYAYIYIYIYYTLNIELYKDMLYAIQMKMM